MAAGESDGATSVRPPRSASSSTCAAIAAGSPSAWRTICATRSSCIAAHSRCSVSRSREPQSSASCAARCRSSRVASEKNCVMSTCSTGRRAGGAEVRAPVGLGPLDAEWPVEELREELVEQATPAAPKVAERIVRRHVRPPARVGAVNRPIRAYPEPTPRSPSVGLAYRGLDAPAVALAGSLDAVAVSMASRTASSLSRPAPSPPAIVASELAIQARAA